jgi:hypothetical protein
MRGFEIDRGNVTHLANAIERDYDATATTFLDCTEKHRLKLGYTTGLGNARPAGHM